MSGSESKSSTAAAAASGFPAGETRTDGVNPPPPPGPAARSGRRTPKDPDSLWGPRYRTETMVFAALIFLVGFAALALVTCLPLAAADLHGQNLYVLAYGGFATAGLLATAVAGDLCDRYGPRRPLAVGLAGSVGGLLICGTAGSIWQLIAGRMVDGFAGGLVAVALYVTAAESYPARSRAKALALMSVCWTLPSLVGPPVAGWVSQDYSWRWVFFGLAGCTAPTCLAVAARARRLARIGPGFRDIGGEAGDEALDAPAPADRSRDAAPRDPGRRADRWRRSGEAAISAGLLQYADASVTPAHLLSDLIGVILLAHALPRLLPEGTFRARRGLQTVVLLRGLSSGSYYTLESFGPLMLISERQVSAVLTGATFTVAAICWTGASRLQARRWAEVPRVRLVRRGAAVLGVATVLGVLGAWPAMPVLTASAALVLAAFGMGLLVPGLTLLTFDAAAPGRRGQAQASTQLSMNVGQITAMSTAGALFAAALEGHHPAHGFWAPYAVALALPAALAALAFLLAGRAQPAVHGC